MLNRLSATATRLARHPALPYVLLAGILLLAAAMRFYKLGAWSFWIDEVYEIGYAQDSLRNFEITRRISLPLTGTALNLLGVSEWSARLVPALVGILSLGVLYFPIRKMFGSGVALLSILMLAISPWHLHWSQNARFYTMLMLLYTLALFAFYYAMERDLPVLLLGSLALLGLATLERKMALFMVPVVVLYLLGVVFLPFGRPAGLRRRTMTALALPGIAFGVYQAYLMVFAGQQAIWWDFFAFFVGHQHNPVRVLLSVIYDMGLPVFLLGLAGGAYLVLRRERAGLFLLLAAVVPLVAIVAVAPFAQTFSRYVFHTLPAWIILAAVAVKELFTQARGNPKFLALGVLALLVVDGLSQDVLYYTFQNGNREDWKRAFAFVQAEQQPGDKVVTTREELGEYYLAQDVTWTQGLLPRHVEASGQRTWFVIDNRTGFVAPDLQDWLLRQTRQVGVYDVALPGKTMMMRVYLYDPAYPLPAVP